MLTILIVVVNLQYIHILNHYAVHLKLICQLYRNTKREGKRKRVEIFRLD